MTANQEIMQDYVHPGMHVHDFARMLAYQAENKTYFHTEDRVFFANHARHYPDASFDLRLRLLTERTIVRSAVLELFGQGFQLRLHDGEEFVDGAIAPSSIMSSIMSTDEDRLVVYSQPTDASVKRTCGEVDFFYGNDGWDVLADNSVFLEDYLKQTSALIDKLSELPHIYWKTGRVD
jgi:hypothetical protein